MPHSSSSVVSEELSVHEILHQPVFSSSSEEPPTEEWSSLVALSIEDAPKMALYKHGLYNPGSGEICAKYIPMSASSILIHPYYNYPGIKDPGVLQALLDPEEHKQYLTDGQELYLDECEKMKVIPVRPFWRGLLQRTIDLKYYGVNPIGVQAMCKALSYNNNVVRLDLTSNFLDNDACYHLGQLLGENTVLQELILSGCRIQCRGVRRIVVKLYGRSLDLLDLSRNQLGDKGFEYVAEQLLRGAVIKRLNLSFNELGMDSALSFARAIEGNNTISHLDLSWNQLSTMKGTTELIEKLGGNKFLVELNVSWNALKIAKPLRKLLSAPSLRVLDLSNNKLPRTAPRLLGLGLVKARRLDTLDLSNNPFTPDDALYLLRALEKKKVRLNNLIMDNIAVTREFLEERKRILKHSYRKNTNVTYGNVLYNYSLSTADMRLIIMKRLDFITKRPGKKTQMDIALYFLEKRKTLELMQPREILRDLKAAGITVDENLVNHLAESFPGPMSDKGTSTIKLDRVVDMIQRLWPERKLPPTPPPEPEIEVEKKKGKKGKKKN
ncbi:leucine-rich repeat-containing protein 74B-like [Zerene cesonia]|uniref:leucine-rich repeat-containing protein 74B-like n=1 Tax=Zerene cesonia TaxID=33412 RepID=UPI0018E57F97|nr:leucine-rich repeat-containing protein 74B-like [Zerene cesonia]